MLIPRRFRMGRRKYEVRGGRAPSWVKGHMYHDRRHMYVYEFDKNGHPFFPEERANTFWHELVHEVLVRMRHPLWNNEEFVTKFADLLHEAVHTAELPKE